MSSDLQPYGYWARMVTTFAVCAVTYAILAVVQLGAPTALTGMTDGYAATQEGIAARGGRKVIYVAGSSGFYGVRCDELSVLVSRRAVNFGLHAGLGLRYLMDRAVRAAEAGDVIVVGLEWEAYGGARFGEYACDYIMSRRPRYLQTLPTLTAIQIFVSAGPERIISGLLNKLSQVIAAAPAPALLDSVDDHGDRIITALDISRVAGAAIQRAVKPPRWSVPPRHVEDDVLGFTAECRKKGVKVLAVYPPLCVTPMPSASDVAAVERGLRELWGAAGVEVLGTLPEALYGPDDAFDTPYHLVESAARVHTRKLARLLKATNALGD